MTVGFSSEAARAGNAVPASKLRATPRIQKTTGCFGLRPMRVIRLRPANVLRLAEGECPGERKTGIHIELAFLIKVLSFRLVRLCLCAYEHQVIQHSHSLARREH